MFYSREYYNDYNDHASIIIIIIIFYEYYYYYFANGVDNGIDTATYTRAVLPMSFLFGIFPI